MRPSLPNIQFEELYSSNFMEMELQNRILMK